MDLEIWRIFFKPFCRRDFQIFLVVGFGQSSLVAWDVTFRIGRILVQTPLGTRPGFENQRCYEVQRDLRVEVF